MIKRNSIARFIGLYIPVGVLFLCSSLDVHGNVGKVNNNVVSIIVPFSIIPNEKSVNTACEFSSAGEDKIVFQLHFQQTMGYENVYKKLNIPL